MSVLKKPRSLGALILCGLILCVSGTARAAGGARDVRIDSVTALEPAGFRCGTAVKVYGRWIAVGAPGDDSQGAVALYEKSTFERVGLLFGQPPQQFDFFGGALAADKQFLFVGAPGVGEVHKFRRDGSLDSVIVRPGRPADFSVPEAEEFGGWLALSKGRLAVLDREPIVPVVRVYDAATGTLIWTRELPRACGGGLGMTAGGQRLAIGIGCTRLEPPTREVLIFDIRDGVLTREIPPPSDATTIETFGNTLAIHDHVMVVGAPMLDGGRAFAFDLRSGVLVATYDPGEEAGPSPQYLNFGSTVAVSRRLVAVAAGDSGTGLTYVFDRATGTLLTVLPNRLDSGLYGYALEFARKWLLIGSPGSSGDGYVDILRVKTRGR